MSEAGDSTRCVPPLNLKRSMEALTALAAAAAEVREGVGAFMSHRKSRLPVRLWPPPRGVHSEISRACFLVSRCSALATCLSPSALTH